MAREPLGSRAVERPGHRVKYKINGKRILRSRYVMSQLLGRPLLAREVVHHIDGNPNNDDPSNLDLKSGASEHAKDHQWGPKPVVHYKVCETCGERFQTSKYQRSKHRRRKTKKWYCSQTCYYDRGGDAQ